MIGREIGHFLVGMMFLTQLPAPSTLAHSEGRLARAARYFPLVGVLVGLLSGGAFFLFSMYLDPLLSAVLAIGVGLFVSGALHEDGLADCADGLGGGHSRERALEIMRDSRIGTFGTCALVGSLCARGAALATFQPYDGLMILIVAHGLSRGLLPLVLVSGRYARTRGLASSVADGVTTFEAIISIAFSVLIAMLVGPVAGVAALAAAAVSSGIMLAILVRRLGGYTGDGLGAIQQVSEISVMVVLSVLLA